MKCETGKTRYANGRIARSALRKIKDNPRTEIVPERCYLCHLCNGWHLTSISVRDQPPHAFAPKRRRKRR